MAPRKRVADTGSPSKAPARAKKAKTAPSASKGKGKDRAAPDEAPEEAAPTASTSAPSKSFVTASSGDAYLLASGAPTKTSDALLSTAIDPAFTFASYADALSTFDQSPAPALVRQRAAVEERELMAARSYPRWCWELQEGFNILLYGFGSKTVVLDRFAEELEGYGNVVVVNGFDGAMTLSNIITALEEVVKDGAGQTQSGASRSKGKAKAVPEVVPVGQVQVSAIEGRVRRLCRALASAPKSVPDLYLVVHSLDGAAVRAAKTLSLLALLAAQPRIHLVASIDHMRAPLLFTTTMATARPTWQRTGIRDDHSVTAGNESDLRTFTFLYHDATTHRPYDLELSHSTILSQLLPPTVFPRQHSSLDASSSSIAQSTVYVLASVTDRSRKLFALLSALQLALHSTLDAATARTMVLLPVVAAPCPPVAIHLGKLKSLARDQFIASSDEQVDTLLGEFMDHGVVRKGVIEPEGHVEDAAEAGRAEWVWIPLTRDELEALE